MSNLSHLDYLTKKHFTSSSEETFNLGREIGMRLKGGEVFFLFGDLGAGKTTFVRGIVNALSPDKTKEVCSPTYTLLHTYNTPLEVHHFDLYRLDKGEDFFLLGFDECFHSQAISLIEWPEKVCSFIKQMHVEVHFEIKEKEERTIELKLRGTS